MVGEAVRNNRKFYLNARVFLEKKIDKKTIEEIGVYKVSLNSTLESIEQLTFLDNDVELKSIKITKNYPSINEKKDIKECLKFINYNKRQKYLWNKIAR